MIVKLKDDLYFNMEYVMSIGLQVNNNSTNVCARLINGQAEMLVGCVTKAEAQAELYRLVTEANKDRLILEKR